MFRNTSTSGTIDANSFAAKVDFTTGTGPVSVAIGDLDGDEKPDLGVTNQNSATVSIFHNLTTTIPSPSPVVPPQNDVDDVIGTNVTATFNQAMNAGTGSTFVVHGSMTGERSGAYGGGGTTTISFDPAADFKPGEEVQASLTSGVQSTGGETIAPFVWKFLVAAGTGPADFSRFSNSFGTGADATRAVASGDVDGDGDLDIIVGNGGGGEPNSVQLNDGSGIFNAGTTLGTGSDDTYAVALGDFDGDGDLDAAVGNLNEQNTAYLNNGSGVFTAGSNDFGPTDGETRSLAFGDVDGDGDLDIVVGNGGSGSGSKDNFAYLNNGSGSFPSSNAIGSGDDTYGVALGDVDGDADLDVAVGNLNQQNVIRLNDGSGSFGTSTNVGPSNDATESVAFGDVDGDVDLDLAVGNDLGQNVVYLDDGSGNFTAWTVNFGTGTDATYSVTFGDLDGDGDLDLIVGNENEQNVAYLNDGSGNFTAGSKDFGTGSDNTQALALGDLDGDNDLDVAVGNSSPNVVYLNQLAEPTISLSVSTLSFGNVEKGGSGQATFQIRNDGDLTLTVSGLTDDSDQFSVSPVVPPSFNINGGDSSTVTVTFAPTSTGSKSGTLTITSNDATAPTKTVSLSGTGIDTTPPAVPSGLTAVAGNNQITLNWTANTEPDLSYYIIYRGQTNGFTPVAADSIDKVDKPATTYTNTGLAAGTYYYKLAAVDSLGNTSGASAQASATLTPAISLSATSLSFGDVQVGQSKALSLTVGNTGNAALTVSSITASGTDGAQFAVSLTAFTVNAEAAAQAVTVTFAPTSAGSKSASLSVVHNASGSPSSVSLSGNGTSPPPPTPTPTPPTPTPTPTPPSAPIITLALTTLTLEDTEVGSLLDRDVYPGQHGKRGSFHHGGRGDGDGCLCVRGVPDHGGGCKRG